jgi:hypothetical protein
MHLLCDEGFYISNNDIVELEKPEYRVLAFERR